MGRIKDRYIKEANRIRETFIKTIREIEEKEKLVTKHKNDIKIIMKSNSEYIENNRDISIDEAKESMKGELETIEEKIVFIVGELEPLLEKIEKLKKESKELYKAIKDRHPELSEEDIQKEVLYSIKR